MYTFAIGDIHGSLFALNDLLHIIELNFYSRTSTLDISKGYRHIFLGDYCDRGPNTKGVIDRLINLKKDRPQDIFLMGNHDEMFMANFKDYSKEMSYNERVQLINTFDCNGGHQTMQSYGIVTENQLSLFPKEHFDFFGSLVLNYQDDLRFYVHAGIDPAYNLDKQLKSDMLWIRNRFLMSKAKFEKYIVHGHTPVTLDPLYNIENVIKWSKGGIITDVNSVNTLPNILKNRCNVDTGHCFSGPLTACVFDDSQNEPLYFLQTNKREES